MLTGGGDCPGLNAAIRAIVRKGIDVYGHAIVGFRDGWRGPLEDEYEELTIESTRGILPRGGTILGTSRTNPFKRDDGPARVTREHGGPSPRRADRDRRRGHAGGRAPGSTVSTASRCSASRRRSTTTSRATDVTFGFDTALQVATEAIDRLHTTAESHHRVMVVEVMGRHAGWIALHSGLAGGADVILIPERPFDIDEVCELIRRRHARGRDFSIVVAAEGAVPAGGHDGARRGREGRVRARAPRAASGHRLEHEIEERTGFETTGDGARAHPARWDADRVRPRARDPARASRRSTRPTTALGDDAGAARDADRARGA